MRLGRTSVIHFATQVTVSVAGFVATFAIARLLGASALGTYSVVVALVFWLNVPAAAMNSAIKKRLSESDEKGQYLAAGALYVVLTSFLTAGLVVAAGDYVDSYVGADLHWLVAALLASKAMFLGVLSVLQGQKSVGRSGVIQAFERVSRTGTQLGFIALGFGVAGLVAGSVASMTAAILLAVLAVEVWPAKPTARHARRLLEYARYSWLGSIKSRAFGWMDTAILALFVPSALIGIYEVSWTLASTLSLVSISVRKTLFPELSELSAEDNYERIHHYLNEGLVFTGVFAIPGLVGAAMLGQRLLSIYSPEFTKGTLILVILILARLFAEFGTQFVSAINAIDRPDVAFRINLVFIAANLVLNVGLISQFGWYGAAIATATSGLLTLALGYVALSRLIGPPDVPFLEIGHEIGSAIVMAAVLWQLTDVVPRSHYGTVALVGVGALVYTGVLLSVSTRVRNKAWALLPTTTLTG